MKANRIVINYEGSAVPQNVAEKLGIFPYVIFVRKDGWSLGAPREFADTAFDMWAGSWDHYIIDGVEYPIEEYVE